MVEQDDLFYPDEYAALRVDINAIGKKRLAAILKGDDEKSIKNGVTWIDNCLDPKRDQKLDTPHYKIIVNEARKVGSFAYVSWLLRETYFEPPVPKVYEAEVKKVGDDLQKVTATIQGLAEYINKLNAEVKK